MKLLLDTLFHGREERTNRDGRLHSLAQLRKGQSAAALRHLLGLATQDLAQDIGSASHPAPATLETLSEPDLYK